MWENSKTKGSTNKFCNVCGCIRFQYTFVENLGNKAHVRTMFKLGGPGGGGTSGGAGGGAKKTRKHYNRTRRSRMRKNNRSRKHY